MLALLGLTLLTGVLAFGFGSAGPSLVVVVAHGAAGLGLLLLVPWKSVIVRRGLRRRGNAGRRWPGVALGMAVVLVIVTGMLQSWGGFGLYGGFSPIQVHVAAAVLALVLVVAHMTMHPVWPRRTDLSRRAALRGLAFGGGAAALYAVTEGASSAAGLPGGASRVTGSTERGSGDPDRMPVTQWFTDPVVDVDPAAWRLTVVGVSERTLGIERLRAGRDELRAVLDCTNGWYAEQLWRGVRLDRLLGSNSDGRSVDIVSVTGYRRRLPLRDAGSLLLATHADGRTLSAGHGAPLRLVAPGRRGFWWVKWVTRVEVVDAPWWVQSPFPLT